MTDRFAALCDLAAGYGISPGIEFMEFSPVNNLEKAARIVSQAARPNGKLTLDLLRFMRNGVPVEAISELTLSQIGYLQLCDGPAIPPADAWDEAVANRMIPGEGAFPLSAFLASLPPAFPIALEVPLERLQQAGIPAEERARCLAQSARRLLAAD